MLAERQADMKELTVVLRDVAKKPSISNKAVYSI
jgi:hypothetical protein